jgi:hypothetical protein
MARALRNEITVTVVFTSYEPVDEDALEALETAINEFVRDEFGGTAISSQAEHDDEGITV